jgi:CRISPR-associated protein Csd2
MFDLTHPDFKLCIDPTHRHDFILLFDVENGNPNGDPDQDNQPRTDPETNYGLVTDVCLKRKVRNYVSLTEGEAPYRIYVQDKGIYLNDLHKEAHKAADIPEAQAKNPERSKRDKARAWMCANFYDVRMFGAVMSTGINAGQVRGPVQMTFARSYDPILPIDVTVSRVALTDESEKDRKEKAERNAVAQSDDGASEDERFGRSGTFGRKWIVPYALYCAHGFFSAPFADKEKGTNVSPEDLALFWNALGGMWDLDHSASRGLMSCRGLYVFSHENALGNAPAHKLFEKLETHLRDGVTAPRRFQDYVVTLNREMPSGVTLTPLVEG